MIAVIVGNPLATNTLLLNISEFTLRLSLLSALNVASSLVEALTLLHTRGFTQGKGLLCAVNVGKTSSGPPT